jgi:predicted RNA methylase
MMDINREALLTLRECLDRSLYALVDQRLAFEVGRSPTGFPAFESLDKVISRLDAPHEALLRLLRMGEPVDEQALKPLIEARELRLLQQGGLLREVAGGRWQTGSMLVVPFDGLLLLVNAPPHYPTSIAPCDTWFDMSSYVVARALPTSLVGHSVLDICSGSGVQALTCASRGATHSVGLELNERAVRMSRANAVLNGLEDRVEFRQSDGIGALDSGETFDFVVCNTPYAPVLAGRKAPDAFHEVGNAVLQVVIPQLSRHLTRRGRGVIAAWRAPGKGGATAHMTWLSAQLALAEYETSTYVDRAPDSVEGVLGILQKDLQREGGEPAWKESLVASVRDLFTASPRHLDGFYNQLISFAPAKHPTAAPRIYGIRT